MKQLILVIVLLFPCFIIGQNGINTTTLSDKTKQDIILLVKNLYSKKPSFSFNITHKDLDRSFEEMSDGKKYDEQKLNDLLQKLSTDSINPFFLNNIAEYYSKKKKSDLANKYYSKALTTIDIRYFDKDSAFFYSFRGVLKSNLNDANALLDFDKSLKINPKDSISMYFYPLILLKNGDYKRSREVIKEMLTSDNKNISIPYFYLIFTEIFENSQNLFMQIGEDKNLKKTYTTKDHTEIFNYDLLNEYRLKYKNNHQIENCWIMSHIMGLFCKVIFFELDNKNNLVLNYTANEKNKINELIEKISELKDQKKLNDFTVNKCLGYLYFMKEDWEKSLHYFNKAIEVFPIDKKDENFNATDCYNVVSLIYNLKSDSINYRKALNSKIAIETESENTVEELTLLAFDYYLSDDLVKAEEYCKKIREIDSSDFNCLRLLSHINFIKGFKSLAQFYGESASSYLKDDDDNYNLIMQFAIYQLYNGDFTTAQNNIEIAKNIKGDDDCDLCITLMNIIKHGK